MSIPTEVHFLLGDFMIYTLIISLIVGVGFYCLGYVMGYGSTAGLREVGDMVPMGTMAPPTPPADLQEMFDTLEEMLDRGEMESDRVGELSDKIVTLMGRHK